MHLHESGEMYLETILILVKRNGTVRSTDIADEMNYSKPSVSRAMGLLKAGGYIFIDSDGFINLTESGLYHAEKILERHTVLTDILTVIGVDPKIAATDACKMEHVISDASFDAIKKYLDSINQK